MDELLQKLTGLTPDLPSHLRRAARHVLDHPNEVAVSSMRALAAKANVNPPTMLRLARRIGFANYEDFRSVFQEVVTGGRFRQKAASLQELGGRRGKSGVVARMLDAANENVAHSFANLEDDAFAQAAERLRQAPAIYVLGAGALHWMAAYLQYLSRAVLPQLRVPRANGNALIEGLVGIGKGDVLLILSVAPYSAQMPKAAKFARAAGAQVVSVSDSRGSPVAGSSDVLLVAGTESPQFYPSMIGVVAIIETLIALIVAKGDRATLARIAAIDRLRRSEGGYIDFQS